MGLRNVSILEQKQYFTLLRKENQLKELFKEFEDIQFSSKDQKAVEYELRTTVGPPINAIELTLYMYYIYMYYIFKY